MALRGSLKGMTPEEKQLSNIRETCQRMLSQYVQPEIDPEILDRMNRFMADRGADPDLF